MRVLIADDEPPARDKLRRLLSSESDVEIVAESATGREALAAIKRLQPDLVFLDIQMPGLTGFGVLDALAEDDPPHVVFVTASDDQALKAFEVGAVDYLLKPYSPSRFATVLTRARERLDSATRAPKQTAASFPRQLLLQLDGRAAFVATDRILRVDADHNHVEILVDGARHRIRATLTDIAARLDPAQFVRLNRSCLVRIDCIRETAEWSHGDYRATLSDGSVVTWSRRYRAHAERAFGLKRAPARPA